MDKYNRLSYCSDHCGYYTLLPPPPRSLSFTPKFGLDLKAYKKASQCKKVTIVCEVQSDLYINCLKIA